RGTRAARSRRSARRGRAARPVASAPGGRAASAGAAAEQGRGQDHHERFPPVGVALHGTMIGGRGWSKSFCTQEDRSKNMNSSAFSWGDSAVDVHPPGNGVSGCDESPDAALTWMSVNTTRPHWPAAGAATGVLKVRYWTDWAGDVV